MTFCEELNQFMMLRQILKNQTAIMSVLVAMIEDDDFTEDQKKICKDAIYTLTDKTCKLLGVEPKEE